MDDQGIKLISFGHFEKELLEKTAEAVRMEFRMTVQIREHYLDITEFYDPARKQYDGNRLLTVVDTLLTPGTTKGLGLFSVDLFIPILTYIFGQAYLGGRSAIASTYRLRNDRYGIAPDDQLLSDRLNKEVIHELGHTFGLIHCHIPTCVMRSSTYVEDIDQKEHHICHQCREKLL